MTCVKNDPHFNSITLHYGKRRSIKCLQCPLWVISGHGGFNLQCPLCLQKRTSLADIEMVLRGAMLL
jgi:hypothetical protein